MVLVTISPTPVFFIYSIWGSINTEYFKMTYSEVTLQIELALWFFNYVTLRHLDAHCEMRGQVGRTSFSSYSSSLTVAVALTCLITHNYNETKVYGYMK